MSGLGGYKKVTVQSIAFANENGAVKRVMSVDPSTGAFVIKNESNVEVTELVSGLVKETFTNVLQADTDYVLVLTAGNGATQTITSLTHGTLDHPRCVSITTAAGGTPTGDVRVTGTDIAGVTQYEDLAITEGGGGGAASGAKVFKTVTSVRIPSTALAATSISVGILENIGLLEGSPLSIMGATINGTRATEAQVAAMTLDTTNKSVLLPVGADTDDFVVWYMT
jgi:hypothetical protein